LLTDCYMLIYIYAHQVTEKVSTGATACLLFGKSPIPVLVEMLKHQLKIFVVFLTSQENVEIVIYLQMYNVRTFLFGCYCYLPIVFMLHNHCDSNTDVN
jgi:hypothetical protein